MLFFLWNTALATVSASSTATGEFFSVGGDIREPRGGLGGAYTLSQHGNNSHPRGGGGGTWLVPTGTTTTTTTATVTATSTASASATATSTATGPGATGRYVRWTDNKLYNPQGNAFSHRGVMVYPAQDNVPTDPDLRNCWGFNTCNIRHTDNEAATNGHTRIQAVIDAATSVGLISVVRWVDGNGFQVTQAKIDASKAMLDVLVPANDTNPLVWWCPLSEPLGIGNVVTIDGNGDPQWIESRITEWVDAHHTLHDVVRNHGCNSPYLIGPPMWGQDLIRATTSSAVDFSRPWNEISAAIRYKDRFADLDNWYFESHNYSWDRETSGTQTDFNNYCTALSNAGVYLRMGDLHSYFDAQTPPEVERYTNFAITAFQAGLIDGFSWQDWNGSNNFLCTNSGGGSAIDSCSNPTNLSPLGQKVWDALHGI